MVQATMRLRGFALIALLAAAPTSGPIALAETLPQPHIAKVPVVVVVFDELPLASLLDIRLELDRDAYPNFAALADDSTWFRNTVAETPFTKEALPALLTGQHPERVPALPGTTHPHNLFTMLGSEYEIVSHDDLPVLCPPTFCDESVPPGDRDLLRVFGTSDRGRDAAAFLDELNDTAQPTLFFAHLILPHEAWRYLPDGQNYRAETPMAGETDPPGRGHAWGGNEWLVAQAFQRHLLQLRFTDRLLGRIVDDMKREGIYEEALFVVAADHGAGFVPGFPKRLIREENAGYVGPVPFFVKLPGQTIGTVDDVPLQTVDVVPTIADALEARTWGDVDGVSAFDRGRRPARMLQKVTVGNSTDRLRAAVENKFVMLGEGAYDPFVMTPRGTDIEIGSPASELTGDRLVVDHDVDRFQYASRDDDEFPAWLLARVVGPDVGTVVVSVNGTVAAVTETYGDGEFQALLSPHLFDQPTNQLEFFSGGG